jgi:O-antigen ligase
VVSTRTEPQIKKDSSYRLETAIWIGLAIFLLALPFHLVIKKLIPDPIGTYWKEILLGILVILWLIRCVIARRFLISGTPLDGAVLIYLGVIILRFVLDRSGWVGAWGLYISILYLPIFWLVPTALHVHSFKNPSGSDNEEELVARPNYLKWINNLVSILVIGGTLIALGGIIEYVLDISLWPSAEMLERHGTADVFIYGTQIRRVYFTLDSPTALANTLAMLLPLALALTITLKRPWMRISAGISAALMATCIILTFSRGIWVAVVLALVVMGLFSGFIRRYWKPLLITGGTLVLIVLTWFVVVFVTSEEDPFAEGRIVELSSSEYQSVPLLSISRQLMMEDPEYGERNVQTWTLVDPINASEDTRDVLFEHPPSSGKTEVIYRIDVPEAGALRFGIAIEPEVWTPEMGDGTSFQIFISGTESQDNPQFAFVRYLNPKLNPNDRRWRNYYLDLSSWAGQSIYLSLITEPGPEGNWNFDWAGWSDLQVVTIHPDYFDSSPQDNAILRHTSSILDWARDETNRDRLVAWSLALEAWRAAPVWGNGLGTTGVAAFRTNPESAFAPESQVFKGLAEMGIPGFLILAYLWFQIAMTGYFGFERTTDSKLQILFLGVLISLMIVFIEGLVYQNLEVKQVNAYFWTIVGILAVLSRIAK